MDVKRAIETRRAYRSFEKVEISDDLLKDLASLAQLAPSCFNNQPLRLIFVRDPAVLEQMKAVMSEGNEWTHQDSCIAVVLGKKDFDCVIHDREYYLFDIGMGIAFLILRATELGLVAHPIAGYSPKKTRATLGIPDDWNVVTLVNIGKKSEQINPVLSDKQRQDEAVRPARLPVETIYSLDRFDPKFETRPPRT